MRVVFMGTPEFAVRSLVACAREHTVVAAYTQPDRPRGRGRTPTASPVASAAASLGIPVRKPERLGADDVTALKDDSLDVICVAAFGQILPRDVLDVPVHGAINVHASLLPRHRGAAPVERAILEGDEVTGVSIMKMESGLDTGPVASAVAVPVGDHSTATLTDALAEVGAAALLETLSAVQNGTAVWVPQDPSMATYSRKITPADVALSPDLSLEDALRRVRASSRSAPARLSVCGSNAVVTHSERASREEALAPGQVAEAEDLVVGFSDGAMRILALRPENRSEMGGADFLRGLRGRCLSWRAQA